VSAAAIRKAVFWSAAVTVMVFSLLPVEVATPTTGWDKSNHFVGFAVLAVLGLLAYGRRRGGMFAGLLAFGALIEVLQGLSGYRFAEWGDWLADALGVAVGHALMAWRRR
jgi:VanZ family protein